MDNVKLIVDILKFKVMLFTGVLGSGVYLILNMTKLKAYINDFVLSLIVIPIPKINQTFILGKRY